MTQTAGKQQMNAVELRMAPPREARKGVIPDDRGMRSDAAAFPALADNAALNSGDCKEPVVRQWQDQIEASLARTDGMESELGSRWTSRQLVTFLLFASSGLWVSVFLAAGLVF